MAAWDQLNFRYDIKVMWQWRRAESYEYWQGRRLEHINHWRNDSWGWNVKCVRWGEMTGEGEMCPSCARQRESFCGKEISEPSVLKLYHLTVPLLCSVYIKREALHIHTQTASFTPPHTHIQTVPLLRLTSLCITI